MCTSEIRGCCWPGNLHNGHPSPSGAVTNQYNTHPMRQQAAQKSPWVSGAFSTRPRYYGYRHCVQSRLKRPAIAVQIEQLMPMQCLVMTPLRYARNNHSGPRGLSTDPKQYSSLTYLLPELLPPPSRSRPSSFFFWLPARSMHKCTLGSKAQQYENVR
jgi:hypothetical protein